MSGHCSRYRKSNHSFHCSEHILDQTYKLKCFVYVQAVKWEISVEASLCFLSTEDTWSFLKGVMSTVLYSMYTFNIHQDMSLKFS